MKDSNLQTFSHRLESCAAFSYGVIFLSNSFANISSLPIWHHPFPLLSTHRAHLAVLFICVKASIIGGGHTGDFIKNGAEMLMIFIAYLLGYLSNAFAAAF